MPLFHRSHLFSPISQHSPSVLIDVVNHSKNQKKVYLTFYDLTYRCDLFSRWLQRLKHALQRITIHDTGVDASKLNDDNNSNPPQLTRVFLSLSDCNVDYSSSSRLRTPSRLILRVGDLRVSANLVCPKPSIQAFSVALGEVSLYLCKTKFPYNFENRCLPRSFAVLSEKDTELALAGLAEDASCETVQNAMCYLTTAMLTSFDAVIALSYLKSRAFQDPGVQANLTVGELSIFACKDSFSKFVNTISEATTELTALDREALEILKAESGKYPDDDADNDESTRTGETTEISPIHAKFHALDALKRQSALRPAVGTSEHHNRENDFFLDGYDWTTIDQDERGAGSDPPPGVDQVARWYSDPSAPKIHDEVAFGPSFESPQLQGPRLIHHHFPIQPVSDPLSDGDMGIAKYAGTNSDLRIKTRILVHDLSIKIRCFDGYDWPELLDKHQRQAAQRGVFLLDHQPEAKKEEVSEEKRSDEPSESRKSKLLEDLLAGDAESLNIFQGMPIPEERAAQLKELADLGKLSRRAGKYFQLSASNVSLRLDSLEESQEHRLQSCLNVRVGDFFFAETISCERPIKLAGEWLNDSHHPRDTKDGLLMMKVSATRLMSLYLRMRSTSDEYVCSRW